MSPQYPLVAKYIYFQFDYMYVYIYMISKLAHFLGFAHQSFGV